MALVALIVEPVVDCLLLFRRDVRADQIMILEVLL